MHEKDTSETGHVPADRTGSARKIRRLRKCAKSVRCPGAVAYRFSRERFHSFGALNSARTPFANGRPDVAMLVPTGRF